MEICFHLQISTKIFFLGGKFSARKNTRSKHHKSSSTHHKITTNYHPENTHFPTPLQKYGKIAKNAPTGH